MTFYVLSNPQSFVREVEKQNITHAYLIEAFECIGQQKMCQMFVGRSSRGQEGTLSSGTLLNWKTTFEFIRDHPDHVDNQHYQARSIVKNGADWDRFVEIIKRPIDDDTVRSWDNLTRKQLGDEAIRHGITLGVRNGNTIKTLPQRMRDMVERRRKNIWEQKEENVNKAVNLEDELRFNKNVFELRQMCAQRGIPHGGNTTKEEMISALLKPVEVPEVKYDYIKMTANELKRLAKDRQMSFSNSLSKAALVKLHVEYENKDKPPIVYNDNDDDSIVYSDFIAGHRIRIRRNDNYIMATDLSKASNVRSKTCHEFLSILRTKEIVAELSQKFPNEPIFETIKNEGPRRSGTWMHPHLITQFASWISPKFAVLVSSWVHEWAKTSDSNKKEYTDALCKLEAPVYEKCELAIQQKLHATLGGEVEVKTPVGYIDLLTTDEIIEIKLFACWKGALGQILAYGHFFPDKKKRIHLFGFRGDEDTDTIRGVLHQHGVELSVETT